MSPAESRRRLLEFVADPEGAYPVIRAAIQERAGRRVSMLLTTRPKPDEAYARLLAEHEMYLFLTSLLEPEQFVQAFSPVEE